MLMQTLLKRCRAAFNWDGGAEASLQARELITLAQARHFAPVVDLQGTWLPGVEGADPLLLTLREVARSLAAATAATFPYHRLQHLERATHALDALANQTYLFNNLGYC